MIPEITTSRLVLREVQPEDQSFIFEGLSHPKVIPFYGVRYDSYEATAAQMEWYRKLVQEGSGLSWIILHKETGERMGDISVYAYKPKHNKAEVGFWLLPQYWKKGFALEALQAAAAYWQKEKGLHRLEAFVEEGNSASAQLLQKGGFQYEGTMRDCEIKNGTYISLQIFARLLD
jgi:[ribosomal protein S5]-alanine N-acetyltransferase